MLIWTAVVASLLLVPLVAMQFTDEVNWQPTDFAIMGGALMALGLAYELVAARSTRTLYRGALAVGLVGHFLLFWVNAAVGLIGNEENPANLMYVGVLFVALVGAFVARFRPSGMARALIATAVAQMAVAVIAWAAGLGFTLLLNGFFAALWMGSALLFRRAEDAAPA